MTWSVEVTLPDPAFEAVTADAGGGPARHRIEQELIAVVDECGLFDQPEVRFVATSAALRGQPVRVSVDGRSCLMPPWVQGEAVAYVLGSAAVPSRVTAEDLVAVPSPAQLYEVLALIARAAIAEQPGVLVPADDPLGDVLGLGLSIAGEDQQELRDDLRSDRVDTVLERLSAATLELLVEPGYLRALTTSRPGAELFTFMREGLFEELGLVFPPMHVRPDPTLHPGGFAFRLNAVRVMPRTGLALDTIFVNDTVDRLKLLDVPGVASTNPATHQPGSIVPGDTKTQLEDLGLTVWDPFGYFILALAAEIRRHAAHLMSPNLLLNTIDTLGNAFPAVTAEAGRLGLEPALGPLLRSLLAEQISIRNLRQILQLAVRHAVAPEITDGLDLARFVRAGLAEQIGFSASRGTGVVVVYLLDPAIEQELADREAQAVAVEPALAEDLRNALYDELRYLSETAQVPCLLTRPGCRATVRDLLSKEFPALRVLDYRDVPAHYNVQPVARISR